MVEIQKFHNFDQACQDLVSGSMPFGRGRRHEFVFLRFGFGRGERKRPCPRRVRRSRLAGGWDDPVAKTPLATDRACEGGETRRLVEGMGMTPVVPPKSNRKTDRETCKFRNEIEQLFRKLKGCRRIFTQFDKLDVTFAGFLNFARAVELIYDLA